VLASCKGEFIDPGLSPPPRCEGTPPVEPNAFSDGSLINTEVPSLGLGGAGIWYPNRNVSLHPPQQNEEDNAVITYKDGGMALHGAIFGPKASSTRTELAGGIMALSFSGPLHLASDSLKFVRWANKILFDISWTPGKPWELIADGDLWSIFCEHAASRGVDGIRITWVKGHSTLDHVERGVTTFFNKLGNDMADAHARQGVDCHTVGVVALACCYARRMQLYCKLIHNIHELYLRVLPADQILRDKAKQARGRLVNGKILEPLVSIPCTLSNALPGTGKNLALTNPCAAQDRSRTSAFMQVWAFISYIRLVPTDAGQQGVSWIELFSLFEMIGGSVDDLHRQIEHKATTRSSLRKSLLCFKKTFRKVVLLCVETCDQCLFRPSRLPEPRLKPVAYGNFTSCLMFRLDLPLDHAKSIVHALLSLRMKVTGKTRDKMEQGNLHLTPKKLTLRGVPPWSEFPPSQTPSLSLYLLLCTRCGTRLRWTRLM